MGDKITVRKKGRKRDYKLEEPAPRVVHDEVRANVRGEGERTFLMFDVIGWIFGGKAHTPDGR